MASSYAYKQLPEVVYFIHVARIRKIGSRISSAQMTHGLKLLLSYTLSHPKSKFINPLLVRNGILLALVFLPKVESCI